MTPLTNELITQNAGMDMRTEIRRERTIELFNEGFRLDDLKTLEDSRNRNADGYCRNSVERYGV